MIVTYQINQTLEMIEIVIKIIKTCLFRLEIHESSNEYNDMQPQTKHTSGE